MDNSINDIFIKIIYIVMIISSIFFLWILYNLYTCNANKNDIIAHDARYISPLNRDAELNIINYVLSDWGDKKYNSSRECKGSVYYSNKKPYKYLFTPNFEQNDDIIATNNRSAHKKSLRFNKSYLLNDYPLEHRIGYKDNLTNNEISKVWGRGIQTSVLNNNETCNLQTNDYSLDKLYNEILGLSIYDHSNNTQNITGNIKNEQLYVANNYLIKE